MSKKDDFAAAMQCRRPPTAVPLWELEFHPWDAASGRHVVLGREFEALSPAQQEKAVQTNAEIMAAVCEDMHFAAMTAPGRYWEIAPCEPAFYWLPGEWRFPQTQALRRTLPKDVLLIAGSGGVMAMPGAAEYVDFCYLLHDDPAKVDERAKDHLAGGLDRAKRLRDAGCDAVFTASDLADNHGPFFSPPQMQRFVLPYMTQWAAAVAEMGMFSILHCDGNIMPCLEDFAATGLNAIQAIDPTAGMDMASAKAKVNGRVCLCGNVSVGNLVLGTPQSIYDETAKLLQTCKAGGGLVLGASNAVQPEVKMENYRALVAAWKDHGQYT